MHEEMKQSELSAQLSGADSALTGTFRRNTLRDRPCFGWVMWLIFVVIVQAIRHAIRLYVLDVVMSVIFSVIFPGNVNGTMQR